MMTLEDFQRQVLLPLRNQRDEKIAALDDEYRAVDYAYRTRCNDIHDKRAQLQCDLRRRYAEENIKLRDAAMEADLYRRKGHEQIKTRRARINEQYQDAVAFCYARFNDERAQQGEPPVPCPIIIDSCCTTEDKNKQENKQENNQSQKGGTI